MSTIELDAEAQAVVDDQIARGRYRDPAEVVRAALTGLQQGERDTRDRLLGLGASIAASLADPRPSIPADVVFDRLAHKHAERMKGRGGD